ncbi:MAG: XdhC family protein [Chloroflexi bacterium]|nr:XdhC family protein [Chloroflexota bacterium]
MSEFLEISRAASEALARSERVCLVTLVRVRGSAPRHNGARMLVWPNGQFNGTIGGGTLEWRAVKDAQAAFASGKKLDALVSVAAVGANG